MNLHDNKPTWKIDPKEYMQDGWDRGGEVRYKRGSRHNKIGMTIMWVYYIFFIFMVIRLIVVLNT
jgi:hypothetical protein